MTYTLLLGDCLDRLNEIETGSVDVVFSDPPYPYIKREYGYWTEADWMPMMQEVVRQSRRVLKPTGSAVFVLQPNSEKVGKMRLWLWRFMVWAGEEWGIIQDAYWWNYVTAPTVHTHRDNGLMRPSVKSIVWLGGQNCYRNQKDVLWRESEWSKANAARERFLKYTPSGYSRRQARTAEAALERGGTTPFNFLPAGNSDAQSSAGSYGHGAGTPLKLCDWWVRYICPPGGVVLDPFSGTGTTGVAALRNGCDYIGIERMEKYHLVAHSRLAAEAAKMNNTDLPMFAGVAAQ